MQGDVQHTVVPNTYAEGGLQQLASGRGQAYQGFLPANMGQQQQQQDTDSSRSPENLHSPPEPAGSSYSSSVFVSVSQGSCPALQPLVEHRVLLLQQLITHCYLLPPCCTAAHAGWCSGWHHRAYCNVPCGYHQDADASTQPPRPAREFRSGSQCAGVQFIFRRKAQFCQPTALWELL